VNTLANKEKLLVSVQKYLEKGRISKAIGVLEKIVKIDPKDSRCRLKIAELYAQEGSRNKAVETYEDVAKFYLDNNFSLKAIAVFKQILKLAPDKKELHKQLGELNEQQGLIGNALSEYKHLAEHYQKQEMISETHWVLKKIAKLEPKNIPVRMKVAEYSYRLDAKEDAKKELDLIYTLLKNSGDHPAFGKFFDFYLSLFPEEFAIELAAAEWLLGQENPDEGIAALEKLRLKEPQNAKLLKALASGYEKSKNPPKYQVVLTELLNQSPEDLDLCQKCVHACVAAGDPTGAVAILRKCEEAFRLQNRVSELQDLYERLAEEFHGAAKNEEVFSTLRDIIKDSTDYSQGVDFGSFSRPTDKDDLDTALTGDFSFQDSQAGSDQESPPAEVLLGADDLVEEDPGSITLDEEEFILEMSGDADSFNLSPAPNKSPADEVAAIAGNVSEISLEKVENPSTDAAVEFEESFFEFDLSDELSDIEGAQAAPDPHAELEEADFYLRQGLFDEAARVCQKILDAKPDFKDAHNKLTLIEKKRAESVSIAESGNALRGGSTAGESLGIDIFSQQSEDDFFLDVLMADSQKGVKTVISHEDTESHFNLGIAYKEMGQFSEAISEFEQAKKDPVRYVDCITLIAGCLVQKGSFEEAENVYAEALAEDVSDDDCLVLNFEMGLLYLDQGKSTEALDKFHFVLNLDPFYRDVGERVKKLQESLGTGGDFQHSSAEEDEALTANGRKNRVSYV